MGRLTTILDESSISALLATDRIDVGESSIISAGEKIPSDGHHKTILIGLGGIGVKTLDYVKRAVVKQLQEDWRNNLAFLAIDTDFNTLDQATNLEVKEKVCITKAGADARLKKKPAWPLPWQAFADCEAASYIASLEGPGAGMKRIIGKMKVHDKPATGKGADEEIIERIRSITGEMDLETDQAFYQFYVIGSVQGGTCSGSFLEMPALIHEAAAKKEKIKVNAMLFLPDTQTGKLTQFKTNLEANGYASLKELNYFEGLTMRRDFPETWTANSDAGHTELRLTSDDDFFNMPFLIGTSAGPKMDSELIARETIAEFFISILGKAATQTADGEDAFMMDSFFDNAQHAASQKNSMPGDPEHEAFGEAHEFPKRFCTLGFAKAAAPQNIISAYAITTACRDAGLIPVSQKERQQIMATAEPNTLLPFRAADDFYPAKVGTKQALEMIQPLVEYMSRYAKCSFNYKTYFHVETIEWRDIRDGRCDGASFDQHVSTYVANMTSIEQNKAKVEGLREAYQEFKVKVKEYVGKEGPAAFQNLYLGKFIPENGNAGVGIRDMLSRIAEGRDPESGEKIQVVLVQNAQARRDAAKREITESSAGLVGGIANLVAGKHAQQVQKWLTAYENWVNVQVETARREYIEGPIGQFMEIVAKPTALLNDDIAAFGRIISAISAGYAEQSSKLSDFAKFATVSDNHTEVNIAAVNMSAYRWIQEEAEKNARIVDGKRVRDELVNDFFSNPDAWLNYKDTVVGIKGGKPLLENEEVPVPARGRFDACMKNVVKVNTDISVKKLFNAVSENGTSYKDFAVAIVNKLDIQSRALFNGETGGREALYLMYPKALETDAATQPIVEAIKTAATQKYPEISFCCTDYSDSIMMYRLIAPFEIYRLRQLADWEKAYDAHRGAQYGMHGNSPDTTKTFENGRAVYTEQRKWVDYPAITAPVGDPMVADDGGHYTKEGERRLAMKKVLDEARERGVLYSVENDGTWWIYYVYCNAARTWKCNIDRIREMDGLIPIGEAVAQAIASQNGVRYEDIAKQVRLSSGGLLDQESNTEELAWERAYRVLFAHIPMFNRIRDTLNRCYREITDEIIEHNALAMKRWIPAKLVKLVQGGVLSRDEENTWNIIEENGAETIVAKLSDRAIARMQIRDPYGASIIDAGLSFYYLYKVMDGEDAGLKAVIENIDEYLALARSNLRSATDEESDAWFALADKFIQEANTLEGYGVDLEAFEGNLPASFKRRMKDDFDIVEEADLRDICQFYKSMNLWRRIR